jgi:hypothetical protein
MVRLVNLRRIEPPRTPKFAKEMQGIEPRRHDEHDENTWTEVVCLKNKELRAPAFKQIVSCASSKVFLRRVRRAVVVQCISLGVLGVLGG